jgi:pimeloyl-ACP methyl ester carboxylesterase
MMESSQLLPDRPPDFLDVGEGADHRRIAWRGVAPRDSRPGIVWLGGFRSDMKGGKATALEAHAAATGRGFLRFDYSGHGESDGRFEDGTIGRWLEESVAVIRTETKGPQIFVGSSMGGWVALLVARELAESGDAARIAGHVLVAPAVDFTQALMEPSLPPEGRAAIARDGVWLRPSAYSDEPYPITRGLIEEGRRHVLLDRPLRAWGPVHILQGMQDPSVPYAHALKIVEHFAEDPVVLTLVKDGDHRLTRDEDIARMIAAVERIA